MEKGSVNTTNLYKGQCYLDSNIIYCLCLQVVTPVDPFSNVFRREYPTSISHLEPHLGNNLH